MGLKKKKPDHLDAKLAMISRQLTDIQDGVAMIPLGDDERRSSEMAMLLERSALYDRDIRLLEQARMVQVEKICDRLARIEEQIVGARTTPSNTHHDPTWRRIRWALSRVLGRKSDKRYFLP